MPAQSNLLMNPMLANLSPADQQSLLQLQQRQAIGQAMLQQGMQPLDTSNAQVGGLAYRVSPLQGAAKLLQTYLGNKMSMDSMGQQAQLMGQMYGNAFGTNQQPAQQAPAQQAAPTDAGGMTGDQSGPGVVSSPVATPGSAPSAPQLGAAMGAGAAPIAAPQQMPNGALTLPGKTPQQSMMLYSMLGPEGYARVLSQWGAPTDATRMAQQSGQDPRAANANALFKANYVAPITGTGTFRDPRTMQPVAFNPDIPAGTTPLYDASGNVAQVNPIAGAQSAIQGNAAASAAGGAQYKPVQVFNPRTNQMEYSNEAAVTNPAAPAPLRNNNPGAMMPGGKLAQYPDMQSGLAAMDQNLASYGKQGVNTLSGVISKWAPPNENDTQAYIQDVSQRLGIPANQKVDLTNPAQRLALSTAIMLHENGPSAVFSGGGSQGSGAPAAAPPLGAVSNANAAQQASADSMKASYAKLQGVNSSANGALDALQKMQALAANKNPALTAGALGTAIAPIMSPDAAEYEKQRANVVSLLANQNGTNGSDAGRALTGESVPDYGKPKQAIQDGLQTQINQVRAQQLKANVLTPVYQTGDSKAYTTLENQFDQTVKPSMMPQLTTLVAMPAGPQRAIALKQAIADPQMKSALDLMVQTGQLK